MPVEKCVVLTKRRGPYLAIIKVSSRSVYTVGEWCISGDLELGGASL